MMEVSGICFWAQPELLMSRSQGLNSFFKYICIFLNKTKQQQQLFHSKKIGFKV